ncbi:MAG TPA: glycosyltransferase family 4 protein [Candidatus Binatia bacterium]|jgi:glycosyltransferase involved in cell wall biosynthesis|nr:glycosyltransferase family 4 protein [Candidatus Binatia bacterium]
MRIAQIAPLYESVPPRRYGGTERVVSHLTEELVARGHEVTLFASGDSVTRARLVPGCSEALRPSGRRVDAVALHLAMLLEAYQRARDFDLVHCHTDYLGLPLAAQSAAATIVTLHGRLDLAETHAVYRAFPRVPLVSVSDAQRAPLAGVRWAATVHHGLPRDLFRFHPGPGRFLLFLGRISPEKRPDAAIRVAIAAGVPLRIAAKVDRADHAYFEEVVRPLLDHPLVEFLGEVDDRAKEALLADALALLFPIDWPEPFGLVLIEAFACGTPVIARRRGSVPEIVTDGVTGFLCETEEEMARAVARVSTLSRRACRDDFERRFTVARMTDDYLRVFARTLATAPARPAPVPEPPAVPGLWSGERPHTLSAHGAGTPAAGAGEIG